MILKHWKKRKNTRIDKKPCFSFSHFTVPIFFGSVNKNIFPELKVPEKDFGKRENSVPQKFFPLPQVPISTFIGSRFFYLTTFRTPLLPWGRAISHKQSSFRFALTLFPLKKKEYSPASRERRSPNKPPFVPVF